MNSRTMHRLLLTLAVILLAACSPAESAENPEGSTPAGSPAHSTTAASTSSSLTAGTAVHAVLTDGISSRDARAGDPFTARVVEDVRDASGSLVIPAGSVVHGIITEVSPAQNTSSVGTLTLAISSVTVGERTYDLDASIASLETVNEGRGIESVDAARVAGGMAAGAILGQVIGGNAKGTIIGAAAGGAAGAIVSAVMKDMDIVLPEGAQLTLTLRQPLTVMANSATLALKARG